MEDKRARGQQNQEFGKRSRQAFPMQMPGFEVSQAMGTVPFNYGQGQHGYQFGYGQYEWPTVGQTFGASPYLSYTAAQIPLPPPPPPAMGARWERPKRLSFMCSAESHLSAQCPNRQK